MNPFNSRTNAFHSTRKRMTMAHRSVLAALALLPLAASAGPNDPVTLRMKFKTGEVSDYQSSMQFTIGMAGQRPPVQPGRPQSNGFAQQMNLLQHVKVTKAQSNGNGEEEITTTSTQGGGNSKPMTITFDSLGNILSVKNPAGAGGASNPLLGGLIKLMASPVQGISLPSRAVKPGDAWTQKVTIPDMAGSGTLSAKFIKMAAVGRFKTAHIQTHLSMPVNIMMDASNQPTQDAGKSAVSYLGSITMNYENDFAIAEGKLIRSSGNGVVDITITPKGGKAPVGPNGQPQKMAMNVKLSTTLNLVQK